MIISQTPFRVSFAGGGTDLPAFYRTSHGSVVSTTIDKYMYVIVKRRFDNKIRVSYTRTEMVDYVDEIAHELVREALRVTGIERGVEIITMGDIPSEGTGLGSSSALTVGLLNALYAYRGITRSARQLASEACEVEIDRLGKPIGKQDQWIAAMGGLKHITFNSDDTTVCKNVLTDWDQVRTLSERLMLFFTGITRSSSTILSEQSKATLHNLEVLTEMREQCVDVVRCIKAGDYDLLGRILDEGWKRKKSLVQGITSVEIDDLYQAALNAGAGGGKLTGAGGGGFLMLYVPLNYQEDVRRALQHLKELRFSFDQRGTRILLSTNE